MSQKLTSKQVSSDKIEHYDDILPKIKSLSINCTTVEENATDRDAIVHSRKNKEKILKITSNLKPGGLISSMRKGNFILFLYSGINLNMF